jgi:hypothetical protein
MSRRFARHLVDQIDQILHSSLAGPFSSLDRRTMALGSASRRWGGANHRPKPSAVALYNYAVALIVILLHTRSSVLSAPAANERRLLHGCFCRVTDCRPYARRVASSHGGTGNIVVP